MADLDPLDFIGLEDEWTEKEGNVYRRWRYVGQAPWSEWELTAHPKIPFVFLKPKPEPYSLSKEAEALLDVVHAIAKKEGMDPLQVLLEIADKVHRKATP